jgi:16S rRNA (cytosine1402-N4)-methyltransferase
MAFDPESNVKSQASNVRRHVPVLLDEVLSRLSPKPGDNVIDCTLGGGGHASALLEAIAPGGRLLGIEWDGRTLEETRKTLAKHGSRAVLVHGSYRDVERLARAHAFPEISAILFDLGYSSFQIDDPTRGFSFRHDGPLDMRFDERAEMTAADAVNGWSKGDLVRILRDYGEERAAGRIAEAIVRERKRKLIVTTAQLAEVVSRACPERSREIGGRRSRIHPATQTFQALRIAVNDELGNLEAALPQAVRLLRPGGRVAVICFHSLEDRIVKRFFKSSPELRVLTDRPIVPSEAETERNPRARSAKLRVAERKPHA